MNFYSGGLFFIGGSSLLMSIFMFRYSRSNPKSIPIKVFRRVYTSLSLGMFAFGVAFSIFGVVTLLDPPDANGVSTIPMSGLGTDTLLTYLGFLFIVLA